MSIKTSILRAVILLSLALVARSQKLWAQDILTLPSFLKEVSSRNLELKIEEAKTDEYDAGAVGIDLPPPKVGFIQMDMKDQTTSSGLEIRQEIPFPTKLTSDHRARGHQAQAQQAKNQVVKNAVLADAKLAYINLWIEQERLRALLEKKSIIDEHIKLSTSAVRSDSFIKLHVLKAESDGDLLENDIESLRATIKEKQLLLAQFVNEKLDSYRPTLAAPPLSLIPGKENFVAPPQLEMSRLNLEEMKARETQSKSMWWPDFELRYKQMAENSMLPSYKEYMLGVSIPFAYFWEPHATVRAAKAKTLGAELELSKEKQKVAAEIEALLDKAESFKKQIGVLKERLIPRAERRVKVAHNLAPRDMETLQDHRETMEALPDLKLKELELREKFEFVVAELEKYASRGTGQ